MVAGPSHLLLATKTQNWSHVFITQALLCSQSYEFALPLGNVFIQIVHQMWHPCCFAHHSNISTTSLKILQADCRLKGRQVYLCICDPSTAFPIHSFLSSRCTGTIIQALLKSTFAIIVPLPMVPTLCATSSQVIYVTPDQGKFEATPSTGPSSEGRSSYQGQRTVLPPCVIPLETCWPS